MGKSPAIKIAAAAAGGLMLVGVTATQADAATRSFSTAGQGDAGYATAKINVRFTNKHTVRGKATVNDICPANGKGAYLRYIVIFKDKSVREWTIKDTRDCDAHGAVHASLNHHFKKRVMGVAARLYEFDADHSGGKVYSSRTKVIDNPHVKG